MDGETVKLSYSPSNVLTLCGACFISRKSQTGAKQVTHLITTPKLSLNLQSPTHLTISCPSQRFAIKCSVRGSRTPNLPSWTIDWFGGMNVYWKKVGQTRNILSGIHELIFNSENMHICRQLAKKKSTIQTNILILAWFECKRTLQNQQFYHISAARRCHGHQSNGKLLYQFDQLAEVHTGGVPAVAVTKLSCIS